MIRAIAWARTTLSGRTLPTPPQLIQARCRGSQAVKLGEDLFGNITNDATPLDPSVAVDAITARLELRAMKNDNEFMDQWSGGSEAHQVEFRRAMERASPEPAGEE